MRVRGGLRFGGTVLFLITMASVRAQDFGSVRLNAPVRLGNGWVEVSGRDEDIRENLFTLGASVDLLNWKTIAVLQNGPLRFVDVAATNFNQRFYRVSVGLDYGTNDWKNQVYSRPGPEWFAAWSGGSAYVKFAIPADDPTRVFYGNAKRYPLHYDFVSAQLEPFMGIDLEGFDRITKYNEGRQLFLGSVIYPLVFSEDGFYHEYAVQFDASDPLPPKTVGYLFDLVRSTVNFNHDDNYPPPDVFYVPSFEQRESAMANEAFFGSNGIRVASMERWALGDICYSFGWALGRLKYVSATDINAAYAAGQLVATDILLTDGVPSEIPYVAGIITLAPATPNSHVAILARSYGLPFVYLPDARYAARLLALDGQNVVLTATQDPRPRARVFALDPNIDSDVQQELLSLKSTTTLNLQPKERYGAYSASTDILMPEDIRYFGGKAAHFGILRRTLPTNSPVAIAFSMDLWDDFMSQTLTSGRVLRVEIANRLAPYRPESLDLASLKVTLAGIRDLIRRNTTFAAGLRQAVTNALTIFDPNRNIRFRSSSNVEDSDTFSGAGLYESFSGCLLDDLDSDTVGPSRCDSSERDERGVFRAIQRVYASFYNDNAFLARLQYRVNEEQVGMGVLVHHSTPDDIEMANGVATVTKLNGASARYKTEMVSQNGAVSVTNPETNAQPEVVETARSDFDFWMSQPSDLIPLGSYVLNWPADYTNFARLFYASAGAYAQIFPNKQTFTLDFEYKKVAPDGWLEIKQIRAIPQPDTNRAVAFLLNDPVVRRAFVGLRGDVWTSHRLKSTWTITTRNMRLSESNLLGGVAAEVTWERARNGVIETYTGPLNTFSNVTYSGSYDGYGTNFNTAWVTGLAGDPDQFILELKYVPGVLLRSVQDPIATLGQDFLITLGARYYGGIAHYEEVDDDWMTFWRTDESVALVSISESNATDLIYDCDLSVTNGTQQVRVHSTYRIPPGEPHDWRNIVGNIESRIEGLTSEPIVLHGFYSQTLERRYDVGTETILLEPRLEPGVPVSLLAELRDANIELVLVSKRINRIGVIDSNGVLRGL